MRIQKNKNIAAETQVDARIPAKPDYLVEEPVGQTVEIQEDAEPIMACPYAECKQHIRSAIDWLGRVAAEDADARSAIADLSVVLFSLK